MCVGVHRKLGRDGEKKSWKRETKNEKHDDIKLWLMNILYSILWDKIKLSSQSTMGFLKNRDWTGHQITTNNHCHMQRCGGVERTLQLRRTNANSNTNTNNVSFTSAAFETEKNTQAYSRLLMCLNAIQVKKKSAQIIFIDKGHIIASSVQKTRSTLKENSYWGESYDTQCSYRMHFALRLKWVRDSSTVFNAE